jgi:C4-dicarboxylate-specific signal transduction histidine kinase
VDPASPPSPATRPGALWKRYGLATLLSAAALGLTFLLAPIVSYPFLYPLLFAVMASAWFGGTGPGLFAVVLSLLAVSYWFIPPPDAFAMKLDDIPYFAAFAASGLLASWLSSDRRRIERKLRERTVELERTNDALRTEFAERERAEEERRTAQEALAHASRVTTMGELSASIAHEVSQPLAAVVTNASACLRWLGSSPPNLREARETMERILRDGDRASEVLARIRGLLRKTAVRRERLSVNDLIREAAALARAEMSRHGVSFRTELRADLPPVAGDPVQLQQVLLNLIVNGIEAANGGKNGSSRELVVRSERPDAGSVLVAVQDRGVGIPPEASDRLFEAFYTTKPSGLGMGLSVSRSIVEAHGGRLWAAPNPGGGSIFRFTLPAQASP